MPDARPPYLDEREWDAITLHLRERETYDLIAARNGVKAGAIRDRCARALALLERHGDLRKPANVDRVRLDAVIAHYNDVIRVVGDGALNIPMRREDVEWMLDTLITTRR